MIAARFLLRARAARAAAFSFLCTICFNTELNNNRREAALVPYDASRQLLKMKIEKIVINSNSMKWSDAAMLWTMEVQTFVTVECQIMRRDEL